MNRGYCRVSTQDWQNIISAGTTNQRSSVLAVMLQGTLLPWRERSNKVTKSGHGIGLSLCEASQTVFSSTDAGGLLLKLTIKILRDL